MLVIPRAPWLYGNTDRGQWPWYDTNNYCLQFTIYYVYMYGTLHELRAGATCVNFLKTQGDFPAQYFLVHENSM